MLKLQRLIHSALSLLYPSRCPACGMVMGSDIDDELCDECRSKFQAEFTSFCPDCASKPHLCKCVPKIAKNEFDISPYTTVIPTAFSGYYRGYDDNSVISSLVYKLKRSRTSGASQVFARMIAQTVSRALILNKFEPAEFTVTYIPRSRNSLEKYGFDHMEFVSCKTAKILGCRCESLLIRNGGVEQKALTAEERRINAAETISINPKKSKALNGAKIILLDDIITTGASMSTAVSELSFSGASVIIPACAMISKIKRKNPSPE